MRERKLGSGDAGERSISRVRERPKRERRAGKPRATRTHARIAVLVALILVLAVVGVFAYGLHGIQSPQGSGSKEVAFVVVPGDTPSSVASRLEKKHLLHDSFLFSIDSRLRSLGSQLRVGSFALRPDMSIDQMITVLERGKTNTVQVLVVPGYRAEQIAHYLRLLNLHPRAFLHFVRHPTITRICKQYTPYPAGCFRPGWTKHHTLEGFLYPDTYYIAPNSSGRQVAEIMVEQFAKEFTPRMRRIAHRERRSVYRLTIMASIVEREYVVPAQRRLIASTYFNRLRWKSCTPLGTTGPCHLQADPTVSYALGTPANWWPNIPGNRALVHSPFNTFTHTGLPPAPIAEPDIGSLRAALHPAHTDYYYFATKPGDGSGTLYFANTYSQFCAITQQKCLNVG